MKSDWLRYTQGSILIRGHVLEVTRESDETTGGIPMYKAVVDYFVDADDDNDNNNNNNNGMITNQIQIRKTFETQTQLQQGFGNVDLLVLKDDPTSCILREDWQNTLEEMEEEYYKQQGNYNTSTTITQLQQQQGTNHNNNTSSWYNCCSNYKNLSNTWWWKRIWITFLSILVLVSLAGSIVSARYLPKHFRVVGWWILTISILSLLPLSIFIRMFITLIERHYQSRNAIIVQHHHHDHPSQSQQQQRQEGENNNDNQNQGQETERNGTLPALLSSTTGKYCDPNICMDGLGAYGTAGNQPNSTMATTRTAAAATTTRMQYYCDPFTILDPTAACGDEANAFSLAHERQIEMTSTKVDETTGCYVVQMMTTPPGHHMSRDNSNVSDITTDSIRLNRIGSTSTMESLGGGGGAGAGATGRPETGSSCSSSGSTTTTIGQQQGMKTSSSSSSSNISTDAAMAEGPTTMNVSHQRLPPKDKSWVGGLYF